MVIKCRLRSIIFLGAIFAFGFLLSSFNDTKAAEVCGYVVRFGVNKTAAFLSDTLIYTGTVTRSGDDTACQADDNYVIFFQLLGSDNKWFIQRSFADASFDAKEIATWTYEMNLASLNRNLLIDPNVVEMKMSFTARTSPLATGTTVESGAVFTYISETGKGSGSVSTNIYFRPEQRVYSKDTTVRAYLSVNKDQFNALPSTYGNIFDFNIFINGQKKGSFTKTKSEIVAGDQYFEFQINSQFGFKYGVNDIVISIMKDKVNMEVSTAPATLNATGLGSGYNCSNKACTQSTSGPGNFSGLNACRQSGCESGGDPGTVDKLANGTDCDPGVSGLCASGYCDPVIGKCATQPGGGGDNDISGGQPGGDNVDDLPGIDNLTIQGLVNLVTSIACYIIQIILAVMVIALLVAGIRFFLARGKPEEIGAARKNFTWVLAGIAIILATNIIIATISNFLGGSYDPLDCAGGSSEIKLTSCENDTDCDDGSVCLPRDDGQGNTCVGL